jgi:hypothetical protein
LYDAAAKDIIFSGCSKGGTGAQDYQWMEGKSRSTNGKLTGHLKIQDTVETPQEQLC